MSLVKWVSRLDMNVIFIAHQKDLWGLNDKGLREMIGYTYDGQEKLEYDLHLILPYREDRQQPLRLHRQVPPYRVPRGRKFRLVLSGVRQSIRSGRDRKGGGTAGAGHT